MKIKFITDTETLFEKEMPERLSEAELEEVEQFGKKEIVSLTIEFVEGITVDRTTDLTMVKPSMLQQLTIKVK